MNVFNGFAMFFLFISQITEATENCYFYDPVSGESVVYDFSKGEIIRSSKGERVVVQGLRSGCGVEIGNEMEFCFHDAFGGLYVRRKINLNDGWDANGSRFTLIDRSVLNILGCSLPIEVIDERVMGRDLYRRYLYSREKGIMAISYLKVGEEYNTGYFEADRTLWRVNVNCEHEQA